MSDKIKPDEMPGASSDRIGSDTPMDEIKPRLNKLPWERDFSDEEEAAAVGSPKAADRVDAHSDAADTARVGGASDGAETHAPYAVGTRTYANAETAIDSAANEKLFAMGIDEYEEDRSKFRVFFDVLLGKIWKLMSLNFLTALFNLPALIFMVLFAIYYMQLIQSDIFLTTAEDGGALMFLLIGYLPLGLTFLSVPIVAFGPAQAGMHYILRNYAYETPVFLWSDFKDKLRENMKQGLAVTFINLFVFILALLDIYMYPRMASQMGILLLVANYLLVVAFIVFLMMSMYMYPMMVRYQLTLKDLYRNSFLLAIGRFFPNLLLLIIVVVLAYGPFLLASLINNGIAFFVVYVYHVLLGLTLPGLVISFLLNPAMDKLMMPKDTSTSD